MRTEGSIADSGEKRKWEKTKWEKRLDMVMIALAVEAVLVLGIVIYETLIRVP